MAEGGFLIKVDGSRAKLKPERGYAVAFDYDEWAYAVNNEKKKPLPKGITRITIEIES